MKRIVIALIALVSFPLFAQSVVPDCSVWNYDHTDAATATDYQEHAVNASGTFVGDHQETASATGNCSYTDSQFATSCNVKCSASISTSPSESGSGTYVSAVIQHTIQSYAFPALAAPGRSTSLP